MSLLYAVTVCRYFMSLLYAVTLCRYCMPLLYTVTVCRYFMLLLYAVTLCCYCMPSPLSDDRGQFVVIFESKAVHYWIFYKLFY